MRGDVHVTSQGRYLDPVALAQAMHIFWRMIEKCCLCVSFARAAADPKKQYPRMVLQRIYLSFCAFFVFIIPNAFGWSVALSRALARTLSFCKIWPRIQHLLLSHLADNKGSIDRYLYNMALNV